MRRNTVEFMNELRKLNSAEEYRKFALENGEEVSQEEAEKAFEALQNRFTPEDKELDEDELASVNAAGLSTCDADSFNHCHSTVEAGSWCFASDACMYAFWIYDASKLNGC